MKFTILIEDATEEEARRVLQGQQQLPDPRRSPDHFISWSDEEVATTAGAKDYHEAWDRYHAAFPNSHRAKDAIRKKFLFEQDRAERMKAAVKKLVPDPAVIVPRQAIPDQGHTGCEGCPNTEFDIKTCEECSPPPVPPAPIAQALKEKYNPPEKKTRAKGPVKPGRNDTNQFGIPKGLYTTNKKLYQRLWSRCKKLGIKYEAALAMEGKTIPRGIHAKKAVSTKGPKVKRQGKLPFHQHPKTPEPVAQAPPQETVSWPGQAKLRELTKAQNGALKVGGWVKHNGSKASPYFGQVGEIVGINKEELHVKFPTGSTRLPSYLVLAMPEATGASS